LTADSKHPPTSFYITLQETNLDDKIDHTIEKKNGYTAQMKSNDAKKNLPKSHEKKEEMIANI
jgi:hypothetical protein